MTDIVLAPADVPGAELQEPFEKHTVPALKWWLACRGVATPSSSKKSAFIVTMSASFYLVTRKAVKQNMGDFGMTVPTHGIVTRKMKRVKARLHRICNTQSESELTRSHKKEETEDCFTLNSLQLFFCDRQTTLVAWHSPFIRVA
jgi:hypothetical protein